MIFIIDPDGNCAGGKTVQEAWGDYDGNHGKYSMSELKFFEGEEVTIEFVVKPKQQKGK